MVALFALCLLSSFDASLGYPGEGPAVDWADIDDAIQFGDEALDEAYADGPADWPQPPDELVVEQAYVVDASSTACLPEADRWLGPRSPARRLPTGGMAGVWASAPGAS